VSKASYDLKQATFSYYRFRRQCIFLKYFIFLEVTTLFKTLIFRKLEFKLSHCCFNKKLLTMLHLMTSA